MNIVVDENVHTAVADFLSEAGHKVIHIAFRHRGISDDQVWQIVVAGPSLLITRDHHFTDAARFDPKESLGVVYLRKGNLTISQEVGLVAKFLERHPPDQYRARLATLTPREMRIR